MCNFFFFELIFVEKKVNFRCLDIRIKEFCNVVILIDNGEFFFYIGLLVYLGSVFMFLGMVFRNVCFMGNICCVLFYLRNLIC